MANNELKRRIMRRVYGVWFLRKVAPVTFLYLPFLIIVALRETAKEFFIARIINNFLTAVHSGGASTVNYLFSALANMPVVSCLVILVSLMGFAALSYRLVQSVRTVRLVKSY